MLKEIAEGIADLLSLEGCFQKGSATDIAKAQAYIKQVLARS
jgi:hypothetical protein